MRRVITLPTKKKRSMRSWNAITPVWRAASPCFVTSDEYLSGNVREKLREAERALAVSDIFQPNVEALKAAQPKDLDASEIEVRLGATWIGREYIQEFMRIILKIIAIPLVIVLTLFVWICSGLLYCSAFVLGLAGTVLGVLGILVMITNSVTNGIIVLVMAFLVSPFGIPIAAAWLLGILQGANYALRDFIRT